MEQQSYLVTGGCGFIGSHLVDKLLEAGHQVLVLDDLSTGKVANIPASVELIVGDIRDKALVDALLGRVDGCFHLAAVVSVEQSNQEWVKTHTINQTGAIQIFNAAKSGKEGGPIPVVYASSAAVYGNNRHFPLKESLSVSPLTAYGADKRGSELHAQVGWQVFKIPSTGFRFFNVYGSRVDPDNMYSGVISKFYDKISQGKSITINGDGNQTRDFVYVGDVVAFLYKGMQRLIQNKRGAEIYNVCTGHETSIKELSESIGSILHQEVEIQYAKARTGDIYRSVGSPLKAREALGIEAQYTLLEGLSASFKVYASFSIKNR